MSIVVSPDQQEEAWKATAESPASINITLHGILGEDKCTYFPDYPNLFILPESDQLCGYVHALNDTDEIRSNPNKNFPEGIQPATIPSRPRAAFLGRSGPRQDLELLRRNLQVDRVWKAKMREAEHDQQEQRKQQQVEVAQKAKEEQKKKESMIKDIRAKFQKEMEKVMDEVDAAKEREEAALAAVEAEKLASKEALTKLKNEIEAKHKLEIDELEAAHAKEISALEEELAKWPARVEVAVKEQTDIMQAEMDKQMESFKQEAELQKKSLLSLLMQEITEASSGMMERVQAKHDELTPTV